MKFSKKLPDKPGFYWYCNFGEHTPVVLEVKKDYSTKGYPLYAFNEEFTIKIERGPSKKSLIADHVAMFKEKPETCDGYLYGEELWCYIPCPTLPNGKKCSPDCY